MLVMKAPKWLCLEVHWMLNMASFFFAGLAWLEFLEISVMFVERCLIHVFLIERNENDL